MSGRVWRSQEGRRRVDPGLQRLGGECGGIGDRRQDLLGVRRILGECQFGGWPGDSGQGDRPLAETGETSCGVLRSARLQRHAEHDGLLGQRIARRHQGGERPLNVRIGVEVGLDLVAVPDVPPLQAEGFLVLLDQFIGLVPASSPGTADNGTFVAKIKYSGRRPSLTRLLPGSAQSSSSSLACPRNQVASGPLPNSWSLYLACKTP